MWEGWKLFFVGLIHEKGEPSLTRVMTLTAFVAFLTASAYLIITGKTWDNYGVFAVIACGGGVGGQLVNKVVNNTLASPPEVPYVKSVTAGEERIYEEKPTNLSGGRERC